MTNPLSAIQQHAEAINRRDLDAYVASMAFPFTYQNYNGVAITMDTVAECKGSSSLPWDVILQTDPTWSHSEFDDAIEVASSVSSAVFKVSFRRVNRAGESSPTYDAIWIATCRDGHWGVQFRHNLGQRL